MFHKQTYLSLAMSLGGRHDHTLAIGPQSRKQSTAGHGFELKTSWSQIPDLNYYGLLPIWPPDSSCAWESRSLSCNALPKDAKAWGIQ